ncbi:hypothetical protein D3C75_827440 [compost metagenome]
MAAGAGLPDHFTGWPFMRKDKSMTGLPAAAWAASAGSEAGSAWPMTKAMLPLGVVSSPASMPEVTVTLASSVLIRSGCPFARASNAEDGKLSWYSLAPLMAST